ncbi:MAG: hypothetical protein JXA25_19955 [Anaerolineales bacterium]|nr:hypothetical protein [Anaerolineales bacterium]
MEGPEMVEIDIQEDAWNEEKETQPEPVKARMTKWTIILSAAGAIALGFGAFRESGISQWVRQSSIRAG